MALKTDSYIKYKLLTATLILGLLPTMASAQDLQPIDTSVISTSLAKSKTVKKAEKKWEFLMALERSSNLVKDDSPLDNTATDLTLIPKWTFNKNWGFSVRSIIEKEEGGARNTTFADTSISLGRQGYKFNGTYSLSHSVAGYMPTNQQNHEDTSFQGAAALGTKFLAHYSWLDAFYALSLRRNVHEFMVAADGSENIQYLLSHAIGLELPITSKWKLSSDAVYRQGWTYHNYQRQTFLFAFDINYEAIKNLTFNLGTSNEGSALKANGQNSNMRFFDDNSSVLRAGVTYVL